MRNLVTELQRRNVPRVAAAYALVAWIIIEAGSVLLPTFGAKPGVFQVYVVIVVLGFVLSLVFAWVFEITPDGVRFDSAAVRTPDSSERSSRIMNYVIIGLLIVALAVSLTFNLADLRTDASRTPMSASRSSIAVLPFASRSTEADNAIFADGIHDDLLTRLANTGDLKVISRTSVMEYRDTAKNLRQIGEELGVDTVLEGAVQKVGSNVRINVQLIDAHSDEHLWAHSYDRELTMQNIFSIQSEISEAITVALARTLRQGETGLAVSIPTGDMRAYALYVSGRDNLYLRRLETLQEARSEFEEAVRLDPDYAEAHVGLAESVLLLAINHKALPHDEAQAEAQEHLDIALDLNPDLADAYATLGLLKTNIWSRNRLGQENIAAEAAFERAISLNPNHAQAYMWFASLRGDEQRYEEAIAYYHRSLQLDPLARIPLSNLPSLYAQLGQNDVALKLWLDAIEIHPEWPTPYHYVAVHLLGMGRLDEAVAWSRKARMLSTDPLLGGNIAIGVYLQFGDLEKVEELLAEISEDNPLSPFVPGLRSLFVGDYDDALAVFMANIDSSEKARMFALEVGADIAILAGKLNVARDYIVRREPLLSDEANLPIDRTTVRRVVKLAYILRQNGDTRRSDELLVSALAKVRQMPRQGMFGYGILDAQIHALLGRREDAFLLLRQAIDEGYRSPTFFDNWLLDVDPYLADIRSDERFEAILAELASLNDVMYRRLKAADESGDWEQLTGLAGGT